jgi:transcriptional regulator with XRE-family HTH domain
MDVGRRVGANIRQLRKAQGLSQEELAHRAEMHRTFVSQIERAVKSPTLETLDKIAKALDVPLTKIVA